MVRFARGSAWWLATPAALSIALGAWAAAVPGQAALQLWLRAAAVALALVFLFFLVFFRDPDRPVADGVASPADGKVRLVDTVDDPDVGPADRLSIFMSPKDVHVNRFPLEGRVVAVTHTPGAHVPAFSKGSDANERVATILETELGRVKVVQIAGTVARRIVPYVEPGDVAAKGARFGLIRLGSRCDLYVRKGAVRWTVEPGEQVYAGATSVAAVKKRGVRP